MTVAWHQKEPNLAATLRDTLATKYPDLHLSIDGEKGLLAGSFPIIHEGVELDRFQLVINVPSEFPRELPTVYENAGRIPNSVDWHTFNAGNLCVIVPEEWFLNPKSESLIEYLDGPLRNYLIGHALAEAGQPRPMGERGHNSDGLFEAYGEIVGTTDKKAIIRYLDYISAKKLKLHWPCPCGSGRRICICHLGHMVDLRKRIPRWVADKAYNRLRMTLKPATTANTSTTQQADKT